ncbi:MAG: Holliday junction resolvase RuvX [Melioribacteraceae bacterium]|jgi:putative Holliday junction resolvase|nr:Holliday junction resolvase RuvX [Melioribacteraceae bacterium]RJP59389.1 MAG: Holliday junction resolvase RuvX [Ignavibacteriales bacterium]WKZ68399.1 MAG: Holliday junction resolvase RuvX [Melioribacteraceae bacterium]
MITKEERILAIDFGTKRIGLALTDPLKMFAIPFQTIPNDTKTLQFILNLIKEKNVVTVILGNPVSEDGNDTKLTSLIIKFKNELELKSGLQIEMFDERYSSTIASQRILETVSSKKKRRDKSLIDKNAAAVILEDYLNHTK